MFTNSTDSGYFGVVSIKTCEYHGFLIPQELGRVGLSILECLTSKPELVSGLTVTRPYEGVDNKVVATLAHAIVNGFRHGDIGIVLLGKALSIAMKKKFFWLEQDGTYVNIYFMDVANDEDASYYFHAVPSVQAIEVTISIRSLMAQWEPERLSH